MTSNCYFLVCQKGKCPTFELHEMILNIIAFIHAKFVFLIYKTNKFHVAMHLFSNISLEKSICGKSISATFCSYHILTSSVIYY